MPFPDNMPSLNDLIDLPVGDIAELPVDRLASLQDELAHVICRTKSVSGCLQSALELRYGKRANEARLADGRDTGTVRLADGDFTIVADLPKRVDWDQKLLTELAERIGAAGEDPADYVDVSFKVPERKYAAWPERIRHSFEAARTVRTGTQKIEIVAAPISAGVAR